MQSSRHRRATGEVSRPSGRKADEGQFALITGVQGRPTLRGSRRKSSGDVPARKPRGDIVVDFVWEDDGTIERIVREARVEANTFPQRRSGRDPNRPATIGEMEEQADGQTPTFAFLEHAANLAAGTRGVEWEKVVFRDGSRLCSWPEPYVARFQAVWCDQMPQHVPSGSDRCKANVRVVFPPSSRTFEPNCDEEATP